MTKAPERIWPESVRQHRHECEFKFAPLDVCDCVEKNMADHALALVAAALEPWVDLRDESRGVTGFHLNGNEATWDEFDLPEIATDAQAALERVKQESWKQGYEEGTGEISATGEEQDDE